MSDSYRSVTTNNSDGPASRAFYFQYRQRSVCFYPLSARSPQDVKNKRNPRLVPYVLLDERTKKSNRDSLREAIRTLIGYGYNIEPSDQESGGFNA